MNNPIVTLMGVSGASCDYKTTQLSSGGQTSIYCRIDEDASSPFHLSKGNKFLGNITLSFGSVYGGLTHTTTGRFSGTIESCSVTSDCPPYGLIGCTGGGFCNANKKCTYECGGGCELYT